MVRLILCILSCFSLLSPIYSSDHQEYLKVQVVSDLYLDDFKTMDDLPNDLLVPKAPVLALVGNIASADSKMLKDFLTHQASQFEHILYIAGSLEYKAPSSFTSESLFRQMLHLRKLNIPNLHFLERDKIDLNGVRFLGANLKPVENLENKRSSSTDLAAPTPRTTCPQNWYRKSIDWITKEVQLANTESIPVVILTSHSPFVLETSQTDYTINFTYELTQLVEHPSLKFWLHSHTHTNFNFEFPKFTMVSNQRGHPSRTKSSFKNDGHIIKVFKSEVNDDSIFDGLHFLSLME